MSRVRRMTLEDLAQVVKLEEATFSLPWSVKGFEEALAREENCFLVIQDEDEILGYCGYYKVFEEAEIMNVCIREDRRGEGLGRIMMEELLNTAKETGVKTVVLEVRVSNAPAIRLYENLNFVSLGVRKDFYEMPREDAEIMQCTL